MNYRRLANEQRKWIEEHGGNIAGYVLRYGSKDDPKHYGDGGEAIFEADYAALMQYEVFAKRQEEIIIHRIWG